MAASVILLFVLPLLARVARGGREASPEEVDRVTAFLTRFDAAHATADPSKVLPFLADHPAECREGCERIVRQSLAGLVERRSRLLLLRADGESFGAFVEATLRRAAVGTTREAKVVEVRRRHEFLLLRPGPSDLLLVRVIEFDPGRLPAASAETVGCEACNWSLPRPPGWFVVPRTPGCCGATEGFTLVSPCGEPTVEIRVVDGLESPRPLDATEKDDERLRREAGSEGREFRARFRRPLPNRSGFVGAESEWTWQARAWNSQTVLRSYFARDRTVYAFVCFGSSGAVEKARGDYLAIRDSLEPMDPGLREEARRLAVLAAHSPGGTISGNAFTFEGAGLRVRVVAPEAWTGVQMPGPTLFRVVFRPEDPDDPVASFDVHAVKDPSGWSSPESVMREYDAREAELRAQGASHLRRTALSCSLHPGLGLRMFRGEMEWMDPKGRTIREIFAFAPVGDAAVCVAARSRAERFDAWRPLFERALDTLSRR